MELLLGALRLLGNYSRRSRWDTAQRFSPMAIHFAPERTDHITGIRTTAGDLDYDDRLWPFAFSQRGMDCCALPSQFGQ